MVYEYVPFFRVSWLCHATVMGLTRRAYERTVLQVGER